MPVAMPAEPAPPADASTTLLKGAVLGLFLAVCAAGVLRVHDRVQSLDDFQVDLSRVTMTVPDWYPATETAALRERAAAGGKFPIMQEGLPEYVGGRLESDPRVVRVLGTRRIHPDGIEVLLQVRRPVALVENGGAPAAVDAGGVRMAGDYRTLPLPRIRGADGDLAAEGAVCGPAIQAGASVAAALPRDLAATLGIAILDVSGVAKGEGVLLRRDASAGGSTAVVEWGRSPSSPDAQLDPSPHSKVTRLRLAARRFPGLRGLRSVRLGFDDLVVVPL